MSTNRVRTFWIDPRSNGGDGFAVDIEVPPDDISTEQAYRMAATAGAKRIKALNVQGGFLIRVTGDTGLSGMWACYKKFGGRGTTASIKCGEAIHVSEL